MKPVGGLRSQSGQSLIELAFLLPVLLLLMLGVIELGRYAYLGILVGNAARAGAAYGAQTSFTAVDTTGIQAAAQQDARSNGLSVTLQSATPVCQCDSNGSISAISGGCASTSNPICPVGHEVVSLQVTVQGTFNSMFNGAFGVPKTTTMSRTAIMRIGQCPTCPQP